MVQSRDNQTKDHNNTSDQLDILNKIVEQHDIILKDHDLFKQILDRLTIIESSASVSPRKNVVYYNTPEKAISVATPNLPNGADYDPNQVFNAVTGAIGYDVEDVYNQLHRIAPKIHVINDGTDTIYVIATSDGFNWSRETPILTGEARAFFNVWELRLRSPTAGTLSPASGSIYRVTEWDIWLPYTKPAGAQASLFTARNIAVPAAAPGINLPNIPINTGFTLMVRAGVANIGAVYIAGPIPAGAPPNPTADAVTNVGVAGTRNTLNPGDVALFKIPNSNLVAVLGTGAGQSVDIRVEQ